jgi:Holliday junction resolvasome RuvABC endonuclease subunit
VDPGLGGTGWAHWFNLSSPHLNPPSCWGVIRSIKAGGDWQERAFEITKSFANLLNKFHPQQIVIEMPELWTTGKSMAAAQSGDLFKLTYLIGQLAVQAHCYSFESNPPVLIAPREWKGQLPKEVVISRIKKLLPDVGDAIGNHEADAVGMGLALQGAL